MRTPATLTDQQLTAIIAHAKDYLGAHKRTGMVQMLYTTNGQQAPQFAGVRPTRLTTIAYLNKVTGINWVRMLVRQALGEIDEDLIAKLAVDIRSDRRSQVRGTFPFKQLQLPDQLGSQRKKWVLELVLKRCKLKKPCCQLLAERMVFIVSIT